MIVVALIVVGLVLMYLGFGSVVYGVYLSNNLNAQLNQWIKSIGDSGAGNVGTICIVVGVVAVLLGTVLIIIKARNYSKRRYY